MPIVGLTGNFGMGKSTVRGLFAEAGAVTFDVDDFVHEILERPSFIHRIASILGDQVVNKRGKKLRLNKREISRLIFNDEAKRRQLEGLIHPEVMKMMKKAVRPYRDRICVVEVPLLFESGFDRYFDRTVTVFTDRETALKRLMAKGIHRKKAEMIISAQMPITRKKRLADFRIDNSGDLEKTKRRVLRVYRKIAGY
jgi:dephospho-CoA kinase